MTYSRDCVGASVCPSPELPVKVNNQCVEGNVLSERTVQTTALSSASTELNAMLISLTSFYLQKQIFWRRMDGKLSETT